MENLGYYLILVCIGLLVAIYYLSDYMYYERNMRTSLVTLIHDICYEPDDEDETEE